MAHMAAAVEAAVAAAVVEGYSRRQLSFFCRCRGFETGLSAAPHSGEFEFEFFEL